MFRSKADKFKIISSYLIGGLAICFCLYAAIAEGTRPLLQVLICILGGAIGWCVGLYLTPSDDGEKNTLSEAGKIVITLLSGIGIGKIDEIALAVKAWAPPGEAETGLRMLLFLCTLVIGALFTYISRLFVKGEEAELRSQRAKYITELRQTLTKLESQN